MRLVVPAMAADVLEEVRLDSEPLQKGSALATQVAERGRGSGFVSIPGRR